MITFLRDELKFVGMVLFWVLSGLYLGPLAYILIPITILLFRSREEWSSLFMGLLIVLVLSDVNKAVLGMRVFKSVKEAYLVLAALFLFMDSHRFQPFSRIFPLFLPFFVYAVFPLVFSNNFVVGAQKTLSFALIYLIVPNYVLRNYRTYGWPFVRNLMWFITAILVAGFFLKYISPKMVVVGGRFTGVFGNPNGLGIFCFLTAALFGTINRVNDELFSAREKIFIWAVIVYFLFASGSRASMMAVAIFVLFGRFFSYSPVLGLFALLSLIAVMEVVTSNINNIILALGLEDYFRLRTLEDGSGRYFAWNFAWEKIQDYLVFGGGFANDEYIMRRNYAYLERMGHQGGVHNSYLSMWFNVGAVGLAIYLRSFVLLFIKASKLLPMSTAIMFSVMFSTMYESWLVGSLNPYTIMLLTIMTIASEEEIVAWREQGAEAADEATDQTPAPEVRRVPVF